MLDKISQERLKAENVVAAKLQIFENLKNLQDSLRVNDEEIRSIAENLFYDPSSIGRSINEAPSNSFDVLINNHASASKDKDTTFKENVVIEVNCRTFIFKVKTILEDPTDYTRLISLVTEIHNLFLKDSEESYRKLGSEFSGMNYLIGTTLRDLLDRFQILLKPFPALLKELKDWISRIVKPNPYFDIINSPLMFLTVPKILSVKSKFTENNKPKGRPKHNKKNNKGRGKGKPKNKNQNSGNDQPPSSQPKSEKQD